MWVRARRVAKNAEQDTAKNARPGLSPDAKELVARVWHFLRFVSFVSDMRTAGHFAFLANFSHYSQDPDDRRAAFFPSGSSWYINSCKLRACLPVGVACGRDKIINS